MQYVCLVRSLQIIFFKGKFSRKNTKQAEMKKLMYSKTTTRRLFGIFKCKRKSTKSITKTEPKNELDVEPVFVALVRFSFVG